MTFYEPHTWIGLGICLVPLLGGLYIGGVKEKEKPGLLLLLLGAFLLRLLMASLDPFLHEWDERFHVLVARNMMNDPFVPMLITNPVLPYDFKQWCCNHIWLHKQPLFMWQMALSMKIFGQGELAARLPTVIQGTIWVFFIYDIAKSLTKKSWLPFVAAFWGALAYYQLELTSGRQTLDQNDLAFSFYVLGSIWALIRYYGSGRKWAWIFLIGVFAGCSVLVKWLTGFLVFSAWGMVIILDRDKRKNIAEYLKLISGVLVSILVFLPWQIYISRVFPLEASYTYHLNREHIWTALDGQEGTVFYHFLNIPLLLGVPLAIMLPLGIYALVKKAKSPYWLKIILCICPLVLYLFFSAVATKMPSFVFPVTGILIVFSALGLEWVFLRLKKENSVRWLFFIILAIGIISLEPWRISGNRSKTNNARNNKIENAEMYRALGLGKGDVLLNCKDLGAVDAMFYNQGLSAYAWFPPPHRLDSIIAEGYKVYSFPPPESIPLSDYSERSKEVVVLAESIK